jgi:acyl dehydratase
MAVRGVYSKVEEEFLKDFEKLADKMSGWRKPLLIPAATPEAMKRFALAADPWNPIWRDEDYARNTRWGTILGIPGWLDADTQITYSPEVPPSMGFGGGQWLGENWDYFKPVRMNDVFRVWCRRPQLVDIAALDGKGPRVFQFLAHDVDVLNQKDEIICKLKLCLEIVVTPEPPEGMAAEAITDKVYKYTKEEMNFIDRVFKGEEVRGDKIRWWEDVKVGDKLKSVLMGPTTLWDAIVYTAGRGEMELIPMLEVRRKAKELQPWMIVEDPETGVIHHGIENHHADLVAKLRGLPHAIHYGTMQRQTLTRCVTNWMGDDGFIRRFYWRHLGHFYIGDTIICDGRVKSKRVENGEHLVEVAVTIHNLRGNVTASAVAAVSLLSKEAL